MKKVIIFIITITSALIINSQAFAQDSISSTISLDQLIEEGIKNNPELKAAENNYYSSRQIAPQAGSLPDPMFQISAMNLPVDNPTFDETPMSGLQVALSQKFPFPGKQGLAKKSAEYMADFHGQMYEKVKLNLIKEITSAYYQLSYIIKALNITKQNEEALKSFTNIAASRYSVGKGVQQDVLKSQVELSKISEKILELQRMERVTRAQLNTLLNRKPDFEFGNPPGISFEPVNVEIEILKATLSDNNPDILGAGYSKKSASARYRLAKRGYWPDFTIGAGYNFREKVKGDPVNGTDFVSLSLSFNLPFYWRTSQKKKIAEEGFKLSMSDYKLEATRKKIDYQLQQLFYELDEYNDEIALYSDAILPQARQSLQSALTGYQVDKVDFLTLLNNQVTLYNYQIAYYRAVSNYYKTIAGIEELTGEQLL